MALIWLLVFSDGLGSGVGGCPGPLEVVATEVASDIDGLADEIEIGDGLASKRFRGKCIRIDSAERHLCGAVSFATTRLKSPAMNMRHQRFRIRFGELAKLSILKPMVLHGFHQAARQ